MKQGLVRHCLLDEGAIKSIVSSSSKLVEESFRCIMTNTRLKNTYMYLVIMRSHIIVLV